MTVYCRLHCPLWAVMGAHMENKYAIPRKLYKTRVIIGPYVLTTFGEMLSRYGGGGVY